VVPRLGVGCVLGQSLKKMPTESSTNCGVADLNKKVRSYYKKIIINGSFVPHGQALRAVVTRRSKTFHKANETRSYKE